MRPRLAFAALLAAVGWSAVQATGVGAGGNPRPCDLTGAPDADAEAVESRVYEFARLTPAEAARLEGRRAVYRVRVTGVGLNRIFDVDAPTDALGELSIHGFAATGPHVVEAELRLEHVTARGGKAGPPGKGLWVYRLEKGAILGP
jgi:hypothetical protein